MSHARRLSKSSSYFFASAFVFGKAQYLPVPLVSSSLRLISFSLSFIGYTLWLIGSSLRPDEEKYTGDWYGFAQLKEQYLYAALLGMIASLIGICAITSPVLILPSVWIFFSSNVVWSIGEFHKLNNPPAHEKEFSYGYQQTYLMYSLTMSSIGLLTAAAATAAFIFPPAAPIIFILSSILAVGLGALAVEHWVNANFGDHSKVDAEALKKRDTSYNTMKNALSFNEPPAEKPSIDPYHGASPLGSRKPSVPATTELDSATCFRPG